MSDEKSPTGVIDRRRLSRRLFRAFIFFVVVPVAGVILLADYLTWQEASRASSAELRRVAQSYGYAVVEQLDSADRALQLALEAEVIPDRRESAAIFQSVELSDRAAVLEKAPTPTVLKAVANLEDGDARLFVEGDGAPVLIRRKGDMIAIGVLRPSLLRQQVVRSALVFKSKFILSGPEGGVVVDTFGASPGGKKAPPHFPRA